MQNYHTRTSNFSAKAKRFELRWRRHARRPDHAEADAARRGDCDLYGSGEIRLTVWQNFIIPMFRTLTSDRKKALRKSVFDTQQSLLRGGLIACTGNSFCKFAQSNTKATRWNSADYLDKRHHARRRQSTSISPAARILRAALHGRHRFAWRESARRGWLPCLCRRRASAQNQASVGSIFSGVTANDLKPDAGKNIERLSAPSRSRRDVSVRTFGMMKFCQTVSRISPETIKVGNLRDAQHLLRRDLADGHGDANVVQNLLLLRKNSDVRVW